MISRSDALMTVDGVPFAVDVSELPVDIHVIHYDSAGTPGQQGRIEYKADTNKGSEWITDIAPYQIFLDRWNAAKAAYDASKVPIPPTAAQQKLIADYGVVAADAAIITFLKMSPAEIDTYINTNVTGANAASVTAIKTILAVICKVVSVSTRANIHT